jgi:hypothetical protein
MDIAARNIAKKLANIQKNLRQDLLEEMENHGDDLEAIFDPYSFSPVSQELRDKYLNRLHMLQAIIHELAYLKQGNRQPPVKVLSLRASDSDRLVKKVNAQLAHLNGARIMDIEFLQNQEDGWVAIITYALSPFTESQSETASFM